MVSAFKMGDMSSTKMSVDEPTTSSMATANGPKTLKTLSDAIISRIVSNLPLEQRLDLMAVDRRFKSVVQQVLANEQTLQFVGTYGQQLDIWTDRHKNRIELTKIGSNFNDKNEWLVHLMDRFTGLRRLEFENNIRINNQMFEWLLKRCPKLESLSLLDYRLNYQSFDWTSLGDRLSERLKCLEIECHLHQHITGTVLAQLVSKLHHLEQLTIVHPTRRLESVFASLGPNIAKLAIRYSKSLDTEEMQALVNGNGSELKELSIHYRSSVTKPQNFQFAYICHHLPKLTSLSFNAEIGDEFLTLVSKLALLTKFKYNYHGIKEDVCPRGRIRDSGLVRQNYILEMDFRYFQAPMSRLESLTLTHTGFIPQFMDNWKDLFPNVRHLHLKCQFGCGCTARMYRRGSYCSYCPGLCFIRISELPRLRSLTLDNTVDPFNIRFLHCCIDVPFVAINMVSMSVHNLLNEVLPSLFDIAAHRDNTLTVLLYNMRFDPRPRIKRQSFPENLRITFK